MRYVVLLIEDIAALFILSIEIGSGGEVGSIRTMMPSVFCHVW